MRQSLLALGLLLAPLSASAQESEEAAPLSVAPEDAKAKNYNEVEHGLFLGLESGAQLYLTPPGVGGKFSTGQQVGIEVGYEPTPLFGLGLVVWGANANTPSTYYGISDPEDTTAV